MNRLLLAVVAASTLGGAASAADLPTKKSAPAPVPVSADGFDFAFGAKIMSDYISRGITQSKGYPSGTIYLEGRYNIGDTQLYAGVQPWAVRLPTGTPAEVDLYGGVRQTWGAFTVDVGAIYYLYPDNKRQYWVNAPATLLNPIGASAATCNALVGPLAGFCATTARNPSFLELYLKPSYNITESFNIGANLYFSPSWNNYKFNSTYVSGTAKYTFGDTGFSVSGEFGRQFLGSLKPNTIFANAAFKYPDYNSWNLGVSYAWKNLTADVRYYGSDLSKTNCYVVGSDPSGNRVGGVATGRSGWCGQRIMASLSVDFTYSKDFKK